MQKLLKLLKMKEITKIYISGGTKQNIYTRNNVNKNWGGGGGR